jgi:predicted enzyme related to lactoylglutathione lyase
MAIVLIEVADVERSAVLYRDAFGIDLHLDDHEGGAAGAGDRWTSGRHQIGFVVDDVAEAHRVAVAAGAEVIHGPREEGNWGSTARYRDFDGNVISLTQAR